MSEEFKYIPYDPEDSNLRGLIREGNIYNLKHAVPPAMRAAENGYSMAWSGILLPEGCDDSDELIRDLEYMKEMYPDEIYRVSMAVEEECDKLEYEGSPMLVEYPDREEMRRVARTVYETLSNSGDIHEEYQAALSEQTAAGDPPYVPDGPGCVNCAMRNIIELLVCNEFCMRRDRHRRRRRRFY